MPRARLGGPGLPWQPPPLRPPRAYLVAVENEDAVDGAEESWGDSTELSGVCNGAWGATCRVRRRGHSPRTERAATNFMLCL